jgi:hypothetical protein
MAFSREIVRGMDGSLLLQLPSILVLFKKKKRKKMYLFKVINQFLDETDSQSSESEVI